MFECECCSESMINGSARLYGGLNVSVCNPCRTYLDQTLIAHDLFRQVRECDADECCFIGLATNGQSVRDDLRAVFDRRRQLEIQIGQLTATLFTERRDALARERNVS